MTKTTKKLSLTTETLRNLQTDELTRVVGGSAAAYYASGNVLHPSGIANTAPISTVPVSSIIYH